MESIAHRQGASSREGALQPSFDGVVSGGALRVRINFPAYLIQMSPRLAF